METTLLSLFHRLGFKLSEPNSQEYIVHWDTYCESMESLASWKRSNFASTNRSGFLTTIGSWFQTLRKFFRRHLWRLDPTHSAGHTTVPSGTVEHESTQGFPFTPLSFPGLHRLIGRGSGANTSSDLSTLTLGSGTFPLHWNRGLPSPNHSEFPSKSRSHGKTQKCSSMTICT